ncbi:MAG: GntR family transcriptional regulator [Gemmatimonadota bacterium]
MPRESENIQSWPQVEVSTLADRVYQIIRNRILNRELAPGEFIREQEVSRATGVSRTPVREALHRLASEDFLERVPHRGFRVPDKPWESLLDVYPIVTALEVLAGSLSFERLGTPAVRRLRKLNSELRRVAQSGDAKEPMRLNNAFHKALSDASGNQRLSELLDQLREQVALLDVWYFSIPEHLETSIDEHEQIVDAIEAKDFEGALQMLERNYSRGREALEAEIDRTRQLGE